MDLLLLLTPLHAATSKPARRAYLQTLLLLSSTLLLLVLAASGYILFYTAFIPRIGITKPLYFVYPAAAKPSAAVTFTPAELVAGQAYTITLHVRLPTSPRNVEHGAFNTELSVFSTTPAPEEEEEGGGGGAMMLLRERRPGALTYRTPLLVTLHTLVTAPLLLLGVTRQEETLHIVLTESAVFAHTPRSATVAVDAGLSLYSATLDFSAQLAGLRWVMFRWRVASFVVGTGMFWGVEVAGMLAAWWWASGYLARKKQEVQQQVLGKEQVADDVVQFSDAQRTFPSRAGEAYPTPEPEGGEVGDDEESTETEAEAEAAVLRDSGIGTESTERERMGSVRRRSRGAGSSAR